MTVTEAFESLRARRIEDFDDISLVLDELKHTPLAPLSDDIPFLARVARGVTFVTFAYDIDGVAMEIAKYGTTLVALLRKEGYEPTVHCIGGNFGDKVDVVLPPDWSRFLLQNADGWDKWEDGKWFAQLFYENMPEGSASSREMASTMWSEAVRMAEDLATLLSREQIGLLIPVNVNSNPGNFALALAVVLASELTGCPVVNNNHDFFWEGGRPTEDRPTDEPAGPRDHFFRNHENRAFFDVFRRILPWNGRRWIQVNINPLQSARLVNQEGFAADRVFLVGTSIDEGFFQPCSPRQKSEYRRRMAHILSDGEPTVDATPVADFLERLAAWMSDERPVVCGLRDGTKLDLASRETIVLLQPTRVVLRKRIPRDWDLIGALLRHPSFRDEFERRTNMALVLLVTGPVPIEHRSDAEDVLSAFVDVLDSVPDSIGERLFHAFSVGNQNHPSLSEGLEISDIYHTADMVVFPSETEGRGLPIPESAAAGVPIVCSRYDPVAVFDDLVGAHRPESERLHYLEFPESGFDDELLETITNMLLDPTTFAARRRHNRDVVEARFSSHDLQRSFTEYLLRLESMYER
jgi:glycosyltransferase involved in cell wall biosynthesis